MERATLFNRVRTVETRLFPVREIASGFVATILFSTIVGLTLFSATTAQATTDDTLTEATIQQQILHQSEIEALNFALKGYVSIVFPIGEKQTCEIAHGSIFDRRSSEFSRTWYKVTLKFRCAGKDEEIPDLWFLCMERNQLVCQIMNKPNDVD